MNVYLHSRSQDADADAVACQMNIHGLTEFCNELFYSFTRSDQRRWGELYVRGLLTVPGRKSVKKISDLVAGGGAEQCLQQFVNQSPWDSAAVRRDLATRLVKEATPRAWVVKEIVFPKNGTRSVGVARQFTGSTGRVQNCQRAIAIFVASDHGSCPVNWRLVLPAAWDANKGLRDTARVPDDERSRPVWRYVLDAIEEMTTSWGIPPVPVVTDIHLERYADVLMHGLDSLGLDYALQVAGSRPAMIASSGTAARRAVSFADVITDAIKESTPASGMWRLPPSWPGKSPFIMTSLPGGYPGMGLVPPQGPSGQPRGQYRARPAMHPRHFVAAEWSAARRAARSVWLTTLDAQSKPGIVDQATLNDQVTADLADLYDGKGLQHFEGRSFQGWHHYVTLVSVACGWSQLHGVPSDADLALA